MDDDSGCLDDQTLLYVGIAPSSASSGATLRSCLRQHLAGNASASTLRLSLGCLLADSLGIELRRTASRTRRTFGPGEARLSAWMAEHARVAFHAVDAPWRFERRIAEALSLPLNFEFNERHPFRSVLKERRRAARRRAHTLAGWPA